MRYTALVVISVLSLFSATVSANSLQAFKDIPSASSSKFKNNADARFQMSTTQWDRTPYHISEPFFATIVRKPGEKILLAGNEAGTANWRVDNFLYVEISVNGKTDRFHLGHTDPVTYRGQPVVSRRGGFDQSPFDLTPFIPENSQAHLKLYALDYGGIGDISDLFVVVQTDKCKGLAGRWNSTWGDAHFREVPGGYDFIYKYDGGRGQVRWRGSVLEGIWAESGSSRACASQKLDTSHWGVFTFQPPRDREKFTALWGYCDDSASTAWDFWPAKCEVLSTLSSNVKTLDLEAPGGLYWDKSEVSKIQACLDLSGTGSLPDRKFKLQIKQAGGDGKYVIHSDVTNACISWTLEPSAKRGSYELSDDLGRLAYVLEPGRYKIQVEGWAKNRSVHVIQPDEFQLTVHPPLQIEIYDKATNEVLVPGLRPEVLGHVVLDKEFRIKVTDSPYLRNFPTEMPCKVKSSIDEITHDLPQLGHSGGSLNVWQHMRNHVRATRVSGPSGNIIKASGNGSILEVTCKKQTVRLRVSASGHYKAAALIEGRMRDLLEIYELLYQNPFLEGGQKLDLLAKIGLLKRSIALHERGGVPAYLLLAVSVRYMQLLALPRQSLGDFDTKRVIDPNILFEEMRGTPVHVPYAREKTEFLIAKRQDAVNLLNRDFREATLGSVMAMIQLPGMILDAPKFLAQSINIVWTGRKLSGEWASDDEELAAIVDLSLLAFGPMVRGGQALKAMHGRRLLNPSGMQVVNKAKKALGARHLTTRQARKIVQAHRVGRPPYTQRDIFKKMRLLTDRPPKGAGLTRKQASLLMRKGITGNAHPKWVNKLPDAQRKEYNRLTKVPREPPLTKKDYTRIQELRKKGGAPAKPPPGSPEHKAQRWEDYKTNPSNESWGWEKWSKQYDRNMDNWERGLLDQQKAMEKLGIVDNDSITRHQFTVKDKATNQSVTTRPDGVTDNAIVEFKSMATNGAPSERVLYLDSQLRTQRAAARGLVDDFPMGLKEGKRKFVVVMQSERRSLVRPSGTLANKNTGADFVLHRNRTNGRWSHWVDGEWVNVKLEDVQKIVNKK